MFSYLYTSVILACNFLFFFFFLVSLSDFVVSGPWWPQIICLDNFLSSEKFWKSFWKIGVNFYLNDRIHLWSHLVLDLCWLYFNHRFSFCTCNYSVHIFHFFLIWSFFPDSVFLWIDSFLLGCPFYCCIITHSSLLWFFAFLQCQL